MAGLSFLRYLGGCLLLLVALGALVRASVHLRAALVDWRGAPARLVEVTVGGTIVTAASLALGSLRLLAGWPVLVVFVLAGLVAPPFARWLAPRVRPGGVAPAGCADDGPGPPTPLAERVVAIGAVLLLAAEWTSHTAFALGRGMTEGDTLWYHGVFAARFVQTGRTDVFPDVGGVAQAYFPAAGQLYHALVFFPFDRDLLSPVLNVVLASIAILAAYCIGRRRGLGAWCVIGATLMLGLPTIVGVHPGQGTNDVLCASLLLVSVAFLVEGGVEPVPLLLSGLAAGLALGVKLTVAVPLTVMLIAIVVIAWRRRRWNFVLVWLAPLVLLAAYWFVRNWVRVQNPLPWYDLELGPLHLPVRSSLPDNQAVADYLFDGSAWRRVFRPGLHEAFGPLWPVFVALPGIAGLALVGRTRRVGERIAGAVSVAAGIGFILMPFTMELGGAAFSVTSRYASSALLLGAVLTPVAIRVDRWPVWGRLTLLAGAVVALVVGTFAPHTERFSPWRTADRPIALVVVAVLAVAAIVAWRGGRAVRIGVAVVVTVGLVLGGFAVQSHYLEGRYAVGTGLRLDTGNEFVSRLPGARLAVFDSIQYYPLFGPEFANDLLVFTPPYSPGSTGGQRCREWQTELRRQRPDYVVFGHDFVPAEMPERAWFRGADSFTVVLDRGRNVVFRVDGPIELNCPV